MSSKQVRIVIGITVVVVLCWLSAPYWGAGDNADVAVSQAPLRFDAEQCYRVVREFVTRNPKRVLGSLEARQATGYLQDFLQRVGYSVSFSHFDAIVAGRRQAGRNVLAFRAGAVPEIVAVVAHYDTARTTFQGATDNGAGVGVLLELARVFSSAPLRHSLLLLASDGEEWGMLGAADIAANFPERKRIAAVLSLDGVSPGDLAGFDLDTAGQRSGYTPPWLRRIAFRAAAAQGLPVAVPSGFQEHLQRAVALPGTDQGPFLNAGIPAINLGSRSADGARAWGIYHSQNDTMENLSAGSLRNYGAAAERILRSIDEPASIPGGEMGSVAWKDLTFVSGWAMTILHGLAFLPFLALLAFAWINGRQSLRLETVVRETAYFLAWLAPFVLAFALILFARLMRFLPQTGLYPGPLKDPVMENPAWGVMAGILVTAVGIGIALHFLIRYLTRGLPRSLGASKIILNFFLGVVVVLALLYNSYWAVTFLSLPALIWGWTGRARSAAARLAAILAIPGAGCVLYVTAILSARSMDSGWKIVWYTVLGVGSGMLRWQGLLLASSAVVLGLRFLALQLARSPE
jgi:hypothetical protein